MYTGPDQSKEAASLSARVAELMAKATKAFESGKAERGLALQAEAQSLMTDLARVSKVVKRAKAPPAAERVVAKMSVREQTISVLTELDVPRTPREIAEYAQARTGKHFDARALASIRRDERRSWQSRKSRVAYLVPTLEGQWFLAGHGQLALSFWPLAKRINGPLSARVNHLRACLSLASLLESIDLLSRSTQAEGLRSLLAQYTRSVPGAHRDVWAGAEQLELKRVREAVERELRPIVEEDESFRQREAERASRCLNEEQLVWGGEVPQTVAGGSTG